LSSSRVDGRAAPSAGATAIVEPAAAPRAHVPLAIPVAIALAWAVIAVAQATGDSRLVHHDTLIEGARSSLPPLVGLLLFVLAWQVMLAAMMLPTTLPMIRHYAGVVSRGGERDSNGALARFIGAYALVWGVFGALALSGDVGVHDVVDTTPWLEAHEYVIAGGVLALAGVVQFLPLTDRCLTQCRQPYAYLVHQRLRGITSPFQLGLGHALFCLGCCWALMLVSFAAGVASLAWMAALGAVMLYEKVGRHGHTIRLVVGGLLLVWSVLVFAHPSWLPHALAGFA
jgi:predicted metal-binding membrane protein